MKTADAIEAALGDWLGLAVLAFWIIGLVLL